MKSTHIVILVGLAIFIVALGVNLSKNVSTYADFDMARQSGKQIHISGEWVRRDQGGYDQTQDLFTFYLKDTLQNVELVHFYDPMPMNFDKAEKVVVVGGYQDEGFVADKIITKCPSKYEETDITAGEPVQQ
ncbi:MAG: cytochrome c maturation protein CcmE [Bacteroidia bacterium]|nr:cytochrome c maturation protein CcmE [Bacteroidia bacterium]